ncbi:MAG: HupE/UreJ family protein [Planctomycetaceae bacterium]|nr:HupE/UreJ family protein [Planctomycetaceae bacterium]
MNARFFAIAVVLAVAGWLSVESVQAHPLAIGSAILTLDADHSFQLIVTYDVAASVMQTEEPGHLSDELAEQLRILPEAELTKLIADARKIFARRAMIRCDGVVIEPAGVEFPPAALLSEGDTTDAGRKPRSVHVWGKVPEPTESLSVTLPPDCGQVLLTVVRADNSVERLLLAEGATSVDITWANTSTTLHATSRWSVAWQYAVLGFEHILPLGLDHILFVLGLYLLSPRWQPLLWQVTMFTLAHSITLALSSLQIVSLPGAVVEPLIALSITVVAIENLLTTEMHRWRLPLVFGFGLLHGLGFAGVLGELGLPQDEFLTALVTFNVGVECGQLTVIGLAALAVGWFRQQGWYRWAIVQPISAGIALVGLYWTVERLGLLG